MEDVIELLKTWELEALVPVFTQQQITIQALSSLTDDDIKEIIPLIGPRTLFMRCWRTWKAEFSSVNTLLDLSLFDVDSLDPKNIIVVQPTPDKENLPPNKFSINNEGSGSECQILENLLKESLDSATLLAFKGQSLIGDNARNILAAVIAKAILNEYKDLPIKGPIYYKWVNRIKELFPGERTTTYYIPACTTANGIVLQAKGKLVHQVLNKRKRLQSLGALPKGKGKRSREESPTYSLESNTSPRPLPSIFLVEENENIEDDIKWLENSSEPWNMVEEKWKTTFKARTRLFYDTKTNETIESYYEKYPALKKPQGYTLMHMDFDTVHGIYKDNLFITFPLLKIKLLELLKKKKTTEPFFHELVTLANSSNEDTSSLAGFLSIPFLLNTAAVKHKKKRSSDAGQSWKPSKVEAREGFIKHVKSSAEIRQAIEFRLSTLLQKGVPSQPYIIVVGESLDKVNTFLIVANRSVIYERLSVMHAVDTCYKITWALNAEYGIDTYPVWYFIQKALYKMSSAFDKGSTAAESLLADCNV